MARHGGNTNKKVKADNYYDYTLLFLTLFLVCFGLVMIYSTSSYTGQIRYDDSAHWLKKQAGASMLGIIAMLIVSKINYRIWAKFAVLAYGSAFVLQILVLFVGNEVKGAKRWIQLGPLSFQPSEVSKIALIIFLAYVISVSVKRLDSIWGMVRIFIYALPLIGLIAYENLSTAIVMFGITFAIVFVASRKYWYFIITILAGVGFAALLIIVAPYRLERIQVWQNIETHDKGFQTLQGLYAIGSGGIFGKGLGQSMQKLGFIPESHNDMIFSIICEELGLFGAISIIMLFLILIWRFMIIANNTLDLFGALLVIGVMAHIGVQVIINIAVVTNSIPPTGIPLPFISYGGTSISFLLVEIGLVLGVSNQIKLER